MAFLIPASMVAQVTTSTIRGQIKDAKGTELIGATILAVHLPSGTQYGTVTNEAGYYNIPGVRVGGPYKIMVSYIGYKDQEVANVFTNLGLTANVNLVLEGASVNVDEVIVTASRNDLFSSSKTGSASTFTQDVVTNLPNIGSRSITNITKYNPNGNGSNFGGQDSRLNNFTIDGSPFNNAFGLGSATEAGSRTGSTAFSLDAIQEVQVNVAPFDVRQSGFVGAGLNAVTRSGSNNLEASFFRNWRNAGDTYLGKKAKGKDVVVGNFDESVIGGRLGGAIVKDKVFFFVNAEIVNKTEPGTSWVADGSSNPGNKTRVLKSDLDNLSTYLKDKYGWESGAYEAFDLETKSQKFLAKLDFNLNDKNKLSVRYIHHDSDAEIPISNSSSAGVGSRRDLFESMSFKNSGYKIQDNTRSIVLDLNTTIKSNIFNNLIVGYDKQIEDRALIGQSFPTVDILKDNKTYISFGLDPFTPSNKLNYTTFHITDNVSIYKGKNTFTFGAKAEFYKSNNNFFPASNGVYVFNSLEDFYKSSDFALANPNADTSNVILNRFQYRYSALPGAAEPLQVLKANKFDIYGQDEYQVNNDLKVTLGVRASYIAMGNTALENPAVTGLSFVDIEEQSGYKINTGAMPKNQLLFEPRLGFNYNVGGKSETQIRGGAGIFTGRPPYVWISNQIGNNGILTGFISQNNTNKYPFVPDATVFTPDTPTLPSTISIASSDPDYKFPQIMKATLGVDQKLPGGLIATLEVLYNKNINAINYWNANLEASKENLTGSDTRPIFGATNNDKRINDNITDAIIMDNINEGSLLQTVVKVELPRKSGFYGMAAYTYSKTKDIQDAGSIAFGSWANVPNVMGANNLGLSYSSNDIPSRVIAILNYSLEYGGKFGGATTFTLGYEGRRSNRFSYVSGGDLNRDGSNGNELIYVPASASEIDFEALTSGGVTFSIEDQRTAFDKFIDQDEYLKTRRGQYAERNGGILPFLSRFDFSIAQDLVIKTGGKKNKLQIRADILNFGNMINSDWGVGNIVNSTQILSYKKLVNGKPVYTLATQKDDAGKTILLKDTFRSGTSIFDVWNMQLGVRYTLE
ncbi:MAG: TonB-dependent receptor [Saprospiraceae bacterium]|nr:TonB-dependent receptor [Saprospiraceae bacterium]